MKSLLFCFLQLNTKTPVFQFKPFCDSIQPLFKIKTSLFESQNKPFSKSPLPYSFSGLFKKTHCVGQDLASARA
jgi:hypothetical protein